MVATRPTRLLALFQLTAPLQVSEARTCVDGPRAPAVLESAIATARTQRIVIRFKTAPFYGGLVPTLVPQLARVNLGREVSPGWSSGIWPVDECSEGFRRTRGDRVSDAPRAPISSLLLRPAHPRGSAALLIRYVPGVRADLGARYSTTALRQPGAAEAVGDVLSDRAGGRHLPVRCSLLCALAQSKMLWTYRLPCRSGLGRGFQSKSGRLVE